MMGHIVIYGDTENEKETIMIRLIKEILSDGSAVWNLSIEGVEINCVDCPTAMHLGEQIEAGSTNLKFDPDYIERVA